MARDEEAAKQQQPATVKSGDTSFPRFERDGVYGSQHELQNYDVCLPRPLEESSPERTVWVIFIHGGAWRDPSQDKSELQPALSQLLACPDSLTLQCIAGFAAPNYGLSTHAPDDESKPAGLRVRHDRHIADVVLSLCHLRQKYNVGAEGGYRYVLVGHSAGATLAFQSVMRSSARSTLLPASAVVGLAGIYDLPALVENHADEPFYRKIVVDAFGEDESVWREASPTNAAYDRAWREGGLKTVILGASEGDVLVEKEQWQEMQKTLEHQGWKTLRSEDEARASSEQQKEIVLLRLEGTHDQIWRLGHGVRKSIELVISRLFPSKV
ncbi:uncharacterized protein PV09_07528 [Verruconis gallopava]|uniref:AB hydrolase-1 domain-containing protein n=1 Tax=Verruconis gallopava TaxID=253628 RepID=A0A0D1XFR7_9PEZI|nr:uncharacterized protein PV09_07528 [Verruconis gallopava]KIW01011.1 hypothetical protein PV09_07528 [Verruconis gallopava]